MTIFFYDRKILKRFMKIFLIERKNFLKSGNNFKMTVFFEIKNFETLKLIARLYNFKKLNEKNI
ncbi:hypothetical protein DLH72_00370 [Candidatus Gracilibacteria bacterium]|nr:MAG: hypothetical protein DLH72_00370 [Candidatus Gracilibacteria bacterium]